MRSKLQTARVTKIEAKHYSRRNLSGQCAKMSLWAETDLGHEVWLATHTGIDTRRVETKVEELENEYAFLLGQEIKYSLKRTAYGFEEIGFIRPSGTDLSEYRRQIA